MKKHSAKILLVVSAIIIAIVINVYGGMEVKSVSIKIKSYNKNDHGKFWKICLNDDKRSKNCHGYMNFEIHDKNNKAHDFSIGFIHLHSKCEEKNIHNFATGRNTSSETRDWLNNLDAKDIDYILVSIKECSRDDKYIYIEKVIPEKYN